jgi:hypothetical protein
MKFRARIKRIFIFPPCFDSLFIFTLSQYRLPHSRRNTIAHIGCILNFHKYTRRFIHSHEKQWNESRVMKEAQTRKFRLDVVVRFGRSEKASKKEQKINKNLKCALSMSATLVVVFVESCVLCLYVGQ